MYYIIIAISNMGDEYFDPCLNVALLSMDTIIYLYSYSYNAVITEEICV